MGKLKYLFILLLLIPSLAHAAVYHVDNVNDGAGDTGTEAAPFDTIAACSSAMSSSGDDTCFIHAGTYAENVSPKSGLEGHKNTYAAYQNGTVIITGTFSLDNVHDVRVIGFEFKNTSTYTMTINGTARCDVLYNNFHNTSTAAIRNYSGAASYLTIRGNTFRMQGCLESQTATCSGTLATRLQGNHILFEYNTISRPGGDFINTWANTSIIRNNYLYDFSFDYFPGNPGTDHPDVIQFYATATFPSYNLFFEANYSKDIDDSNAHLVQAKRTTTVTEADTNWRDFTIRGNVGNAVGSYFHELSGVDSVRIYNNTMIDFVSNSTIGYNAISSAYHFNNLYYEANSTPINPYNTRTTYGTSVITASNNACTIGSTHASCTVATDPLLTNYAGGVFTIQAGSPAKNAGKAITLANGAGDTTTTLVVDDAEYFTDGFGLTGGDIIKIGANDPVTISAINYDTKTITISAAQSWADNAEIYWRDQDATPDIGAWEYKASHTLTGTWALSEGTVTVTPSDASLVRFVEVSENGVPVGTDYTSPYTVSGVGAGLVTVRMFSLHASTTPIVMATQSGDETAPVLAEVTPVSTPSPNTSPEYVFSSTEAGTITYGGTCGTGSLANAVAGNNTVAWASLAIGTYSNCTITVNDGITASTPLAVTEFVISGTPTYTLTVTKTGAGCTVVSSPDTSISCGATCSASIGANTEIALYGMSNNGWNPVTFGGDCASNGTVTMNAAKECTAVCTQVYLFP
jgi:hypothetical protein